MAKNMLYSTDGKVLQPGVWKCVVDKLLKMTYSLVGRNIPSQQCGKDISIDVSWPSMRKCVYMAIWQRHIYRCY